MPYGDFGKKPKTFKEKLTTAFRKAVAGTCLGGALFGVGYYQYGTEQTFQATVTGQHPDVLEKAIYTVVTDKGKFTLEKSFFHGQSVDEAAALYFQVNEGRTYDFTTYGVHLLGKWQPNIIAARELTPAEVLGRAKQKELERTRVLKARVPGPVAAENTDPAVVLDAVQVQSCLSGEMVTSSIELNGHRYKITLPREAAGKIAIAPEAPAVAVEAPAVVVQPPSPPRPPAP